MYNINKDDKWVFSGVVTNIEIRESAWEGAESSPNFVPNLDLGHIDQASVKISAVPVTNDLLDGRKYQLGYDVSFEITSIQLFSMFEFEKLRNKNCHIALYSVPLWIKNVSPNIEIQFAPGERKGTIKISGSKYAKNLRDVLDPAPWGTLAAPWATSTQSSTGVLHPGRTLPSVDKSIYEYLLSLDEPLAEYITPAAPVADSDLTEFKLVIADEYHNPIPVAPSNVVVKLNTGSGYVVVPVADYDIVVEGGIYKLHYQSVTAVNVGNKILIEYTL